MRSWLHALAGIRPRLLLFNALLVFLPVAGVLFLDTYERQLLADQERSMVTQGRVLAAALSGRGRLETADVEPTLVQLGQRSDARLRVVDPDGRVLADSAALGPRRPAASGAEEQPSTRSSGSWLYRAGALPFRVWRRFFARPQAPLASADAYAEGGPLRGREVRAALSGRYGAATRISSGGQRSVTLYSAIPVRAAGETVGAVLVSQSTYRILQHLYEVRLAVLQVFLVSLGAAVVLSLLVSRTIASPLRRLRNQAEALLDGRGRLRGRFDLPTLPSRVDEIGDLARSLEALRARLEQHIRDVEAFASDVSHEFKNPLASIRTAAEMLAELDDPVERKRFADLVAREVARMEHLLADVRELSHLDTRPDPGGREPLDLGRFLGGLLEARRLRGELGVRLELPEKAVVARASPERLTRVLENLLDNAASFSPGAHSVVLSLACEGPVARVRVADRGPGVPESHREQIFERFFSYRPEAAPSGSRHTGLGLAIARALAEADRGTLEVTARPGGGSIFVLSLPRS